VSRVSPSAGSWLQLREFRPNRDLLRAIFLFVLGLAACWRLNPLRSPIVADNQIYFYIAERAASGIPPHISEFDPKNALSMFLTALAIRLGRWAGADDLLAARALSIAVAAAALPLLWTAMRRLGGSRRMAWTASAVPLLFHDFLLLAVGGARPKVFLVFFELLWLIAAASGRTWLLGAASACCFLVWQPALLLLAIACVSAFFREDRRGAAVAEILAGAVVPVLGYEAYFLWHGALAEQLFQSLVFPAMYGKPHRPLLGVAQSVLLLKKFDPRTIVVVAGALALAGCWASFAFRPRMVLSLVRGSPGRVALVLAATATFAFNLFDYQGAPDRLFLVPFFAILAAMVFGGALDLVLAGIAPAASARAGSWTGTAVLLAAGLVLLAQISSREPRRGGLEDQRQAAARVAEYRREGKSVYVVGALHLLAMERLENFSRYGFFPLRIRAHMLDRLHRERSLLPLVGGKLPDIVLQSRLPIPGGKPWLGRYYRAERVPLLRRQKINVWTRIEGLKPPPKAHPY